MAKELTVKKADLPMAVNDFYKANGGDHTTWTTGPSLTRQEFADECDINTIMDRYGAYLADPMKSLREPMYVDFTQMPDTLLGTMQLVQSASEQFYRLDAKIRREFDNDPVMFTEFASDPANIDQLREWGLAKPKAVELGKSRPDAEPPPAPVEEPAPALDREPAKSAPKK